MISLQHARTLAHARTFVAALADHAHTVEASSVYEQALITLDMLHGDESPAYDPMLPPIDRNVLLASATDAISDLAEHGVSSLDVELVVSMLLAAATIDDA
jgi:hypothetical protein